VATLVCDRVEIHSCPMGRSGAAADALVEPVETIGFETELACGGVEARQTACVLVHQLSLHPATVSGRGEAFGSGGLWPSRALI
jgi:hypothetical protein